MDVRLKYKFTGNHNIFYTWLLVTGYLITTGTESTVFLYSWTRIHPKRYRYRSRARTGNSHHGRVRLLQKGRALIFQYNVLIGTPGGVQFWLQISAHTHTHLTVQKPPKPQP
jgi:hypothetical protein